MDIKITKKEREQLKEILYALMCTYKKAKADRLFDNILRLKCAEKFAQKSERAKRVTKSFLTL